jgi:hypothetical protein
MKLTENNELVMDSLNYMNFTSDSSAKDYKKSLDTCREIIKKIYDVDYKDYHNIGIKSYNRMHMECRNIYLYTSCFIMGISIDVLSELENVSVTEITKIIKSINNRKSFEDRELFSKIFNHIKD